MRFISGVIGRPVTVTMFTLGVLVFGYFSFERLEVNLMPDISYPSITIRTDYEGAAPEEVEDLISKPIEEALAAVRNLTQISSVSRAGSSDVILELGWDADLDQAILDIRQKIDLVELPQDAARPRILRYNPALEPIMKYGLYAAGTVDLYKVRRIAEDELKTQLERIPGVAAAKVQGGLEEEILIEVDEAALIRFNVSMERIQSRLAQENVNLAGGVLSHGEAEYLLRTTNEFRSLEEMGRIILARRGAADIRLKDLARIRSAAKDRKVITRIGGYESVEIAIYKEADANTVAIARRVEGVAGERELVAAATPRSAEAPAAPGGAKAQRSGNEGPKKLAEELPEGVYLKLLADQSRFIQQSIDEVLSSALIGGILAILVLYFFLHELMPTLIIAISIPISVVATFSLMYFRGVSLNIMSLGGLALGVGMLVDNAIVVLESIFRCREEGDAPVEAARRGTNEVGTAVVASTLTTVAVFFPIAFVKGIAGQIFIDQALTVTFSLLASLLAAMTLVPMLAALRLPDLSVGGPRLWLTGLLKGAWSRATRLIPPRRLNWLLLLPSYPLFLLVEAVAGLARFLAGEIRGLFGRPSWYPRRSWVKLAYWLVVFPLLLVPRLAVFVLRTVLLGIARSIEVVLVVLLGAAAGVLYLALRLVGLVLRFPQRLFLAGYRALAGGYPRMLGLVLDHTGGVLVVSAALIGSSLLLWSRLGTELVPRLHQGEFSVSVKRPVGTTLEQTDRVATQVESLVRHIPELKTAYATVGVSLEDSLVEAKERENEAVVMFHLEKIDPGSERPRLLQLLLPSRGHNLAEIEQRAVAAVRSNLQTIPGLTTQLAFPSLFSFKTPMEVEIRGHDLERLRSYSDGLVAHLRSIEGIEDLRSNLDEGYPEVQIQFDRDRMVAMGLDLRTVAQLIRDKVQGAVPTRYSQVERKLDMRVRLQEQNRQSLTDLGNLVVNPGGLQPIPLTSVARLVVGQGPSEIKRIDQARVAVLSANVSGVDLGSLATRIEQEVRRVPPPPGFTVQVSGQSTEMKVSFESLKFALLLAVFLVYLVMASQFESFLQPLIILFTIPMAAIGVLVTLYLFQVPISIMVYIGLIVLAGIVVNNAIVLIDYTNLLRSRGLSVRAALVQAGSARLRPILMTTGTTVLGLLPMAFGLGEGAEMRMPLAVTLIAGLSSSTLLTLLIIPTMYQLLVRGSTPGKSDDGAAAQPAT
jgi:HAE1 family hydrophobic/amphiphilic exporter-1